MEPVPAPPGLVEDEANRSFQDSRCWLCPTYAKGADLFCTTCNRSYHRICYDYTGESTNDFKCYKCIWFEEIKTDPIRGRYLRETDQSELNEAFMLLLETLVVHKRVNQINYVGSCTNYNATGLPGLAQKVKSGVYTTVEQLFVDIKWIKRYILMHRPKVTKLYLSAVEMSLQAKFEMLKLWSCVSCYISSKLDPGLSFTAVCRTPHVLVWAQEELEMPYWPAKVTGFTNDTVSVTFFGHHKDTWIPKQRVYLFSLMSKFFPYPHEVEQLNMTTAILEVTQHIQQLIEMYKSFIHPTEDILFDPNSIDEQRAIQLPNYQKTPYKSRINLEEYVTKITQRVTPIFKLCETKFGCKESYDPEKDIVDLSIISDDDSPIQSNDDNPNWAGRLQSLI